MSAPPKTVLHATPEEAAAIRAAVRDADVKLLGEDCQIATLEYVAALTEFLSDPAVSDPIYDIPRPITADTIRAWVLEAEEQRRRGEAILCVRVDPHGEIYSYSRFTVWPERSAAEIAGAYRVDMQSKGGGKSGAARSFDWMFDQLGVRLICVTAALDNVRSARVIEAAGFAPMGERESLRPDGTSRRSLYWEMSREAWAGRRAADGAVS